MMNKLMVLALMFTIPFTTQAFVADTNESNLYLTAYTIHKSDVIADVRLKHGEIKSVSIEGQQIVFAIKKNIHLMVKHEKLEAGKKWYDITLHVETSQGSIRKTFRIVYDEFVKNKVIAHRGAWKNTGATENSIAALTHAVQLNCEGSEFDVHMSADSVPLVNHDALIQGISIAKTNSADLLAIRLSNGEVLPTLENYLKVGMDQNHTKLILEIKPSELGQASSIALARKIVTMVENLNAQAWVDYISFDYDVCLEVMRLAPYSKVAYLKGDKTPAQLASDNFYGLDYHFSVLQKNADWIADAKKRNLTINAWTVNEKQGMEDLLQKQVDFITTNEPELLLSILK